MAGRMELRKLNRNLVYRTLLKQEEMSKQEIAYATMLSIPTVSQNLKDLEKEGLVATTGARESTGGRRAEGFRCVKDARFAIGIDITQNHITVAVVNVASEIVFLSRREKFKFRDTETCYQEIQKKVTVLMKNHHLSAERLLGVGVSVPCIVDNMRNKVTYSKVIEAPDTVVQLFEQRYPGKIRLLNDANSAGYAEMWEKEGMGEEGKMLFYLMLSNSVGGSTVIHTDIYLGDSCRSSEIGHMRIVPRGKECFCGQQGCVNAYCTAKTLSDHTDGNLEDFFRELEGGNRTLRKVFDTYLHHLALALVNLRMLYDCDIILGGYVGAHIEPYMERLRDMVAELNPYEKDGAYLTPCGFKLEASAVGAALTLIGEFLSD